jgi:hypothetical protein
MTNTGEVSGAYPVTQHPQTASSDQNVTFAEGKDTPEAYGVRGSGAGVSPVARAVVWGFGTDDPPRSPMIRETTPLPLHCEVF